MNNTSVIDIMNAMIPITRFNKGEAGKIFDEVEQSGAKIVIKNNKPACILLSPERYSELMEMVSDVLLYEEAEKRMAAHDPKKDISHADMLRELGLTEDDLSDVEADIEE